MSEPVKSMKYHNLCNLLVLSQYSTAPAFTIHSYCISLQHHSLAEILLAAQWK